MSSQGKTVSVENFKDFPFDVIYVIGQVVSVDEILRTFHVAQIIDRNGSTFIKHNLDGSPENDIITMST